MNLSPYFHWVKAHAGHRGNENADYLAKLGTEWTEVDLVVGVTKRQIRKRCANLALEEWQIRWTESTKGRWTFPLFPTVKIRPPVSNFWLCQVITGHGVFPVHQNRFFGACDNCICGEVGSVSHVIFDCPLVANERNMSYRSMRDLGLPEVLGDFYLRKIIGKIMKSYFNIILPVL